MYRRSWDILGYYRSWPPWEWLNGDLPTILIIFVKDSRTSTTFTFLVEIFYNIVQIWIFYLKILLFRSQKKNSQSQQFPDEEKNASRTFFVKRHKIFFKERKIIFLLPLKCCSYFLFLIYLYFQTWSSCWEADQ